MEVEIIGRREELLAVNAFLDRVPSGGQALLLMGDPGIGKTAVWHEGTRLARDRGYRCLTTRSTPSETQIAFAALGDLCAPVVDETVPQLPPVQRRALETALLLREPDGRPPEVRLLGLAVLSIVRSLAQESPVLIGLDDVQWIDPSSSQVLRFVLRRLEGQPLGVLATVRGRPADVPLALDRAFGEFRRLEVEPLSVGAIHRLLWDRLALNLPRPELVRAYEVTGGNPLYGLELGAAIATGAARVEGVNLALPESLSALVTERLQALPQRVRDTLVAVAALAAPSVTLLEPLAAGIADDIELADRRGIVELDGDRIRFTHPLLAPACYAGMSPHRRRGLHRRLAELDVDLEERARHLAVAVTGPDEEVATALDAGAAHAHRRGAALAAAELAARAVDLTPATTVDDLDRRRITAGELFMDAGDTAGASAMLEAAVGSASAGPVRARALSGMASAHYQRNGWPLAEELYNRALAEPGVEVAAKVDILCRLAWIASAGGGRPDGLRYAGQALKLAEGLGDPDRLSTSLATFAELTFWRSGRIQRDLLDRAIELGRHAGNDEEARMTLARVLGRADRFDEARDGWTALIGEQMLRGDPGVVTSLMFLARMEVSSGEWHASAGLCEQAIDLARQSGRESAESLCLMILAEIDAYRGHAEQARAAIPGLLRVASGVGYHGAHHRLVRALGSLELSFGNSRAAWELIAPLLAGAAELDEVLGQLAGSVGIEALIGTGDLAEAERLLGLLDERAADADTALRPLAERSRGLIIAARGDHEAAIAALETAILQPEPPQGTNPLELGRTLLALGTVQRRAQHKRLARATLERAVAVFDRLGAERWADLARSEARRIGGRTASNAELSETERRIVDLVVAGYHNREVATELNLSPDTVVWNLSKVYRKLGVSSRTELAAHIAARARG